MNIFGIIQARVGSTRLPGKVLLKCEGKTILEHVLERVKSAQLVDNILVATSIKTEDLEIVKLCAALKINVYCGSEEDVLDRYYQAARVLKANHIVRITSDCPFIDPKIIDETIALHVKEKADYTSNTIVETYPDGMDVEVLRYETLKTVWENANLLSEREHVTPYIRKNTTFKSVNLRYKENLSRKRWTLDNPEDYEFVKIIYKNLYLKNKLFGMEEILEFLKANPAVEKINCHIPRNQGYIKLLKTDRLVEDI